MTLLPYLPFLLPLIPLTIPSDLYNPLRTKPTRPNSSWNPLAHLQYQLHRAYFYYLVTGPGYVLDPAECRFLDAFILILLGAIYYLLSLIVPFVPVLVWAVLRNMLLGSEAYDSAASYTVPRAIMGVTKEGAYLWDENVRQSILGIWTLGQMGLGAGGNATASPLAL